ncbi:MAG TPA: hypothetical protein VGL92_00960 [Acidimicrobiia bacterium]|jgi:hypothetical protein
MHDVRQRFPIRYSGLNATLFPVLGLPRSGSYLELDDDSVRVRLGWGFSARIPRRTITGASRAPDINGITAGAHGWRGRWLVNGSRQGIIRLEVDPPTRAWTLGIPIRLRQLAVSLEDPEGFLAALAGPRAT